MRERLPAIIEYLRYVRSDMLPVTNKTLAKRAWAGGETDRAMSLLFQDQDRAGLAVSQQNGRAALDLLFRTVKPGLPELEKAALKHPLREWRERERAGTNAVVPPWRTLLTETDKKWGRFPRERVFNVDRAPSPLSPPPAHLAFHTLPCVCPCQLQHAQCQRQ